MPPCHRNRGQDVHSPACLADRVKPGAQSVTDAEISSLMGLLRAIPDAARRYSVPAGHARGRFGVPPELMIRLIEAGLPLRRRSGTVMLDRHDLMNVSIQLSTGAMARLVRRSWAHAFDPATGQPDERELEYEARCPVSAGEHDCRFQLALPGEQRARLRPAQGSRTLRYGVRVPRRTDWPDAPRALWRDLEELSGLRFMRLPPALQRDTAFARRHGMADCAGTALLLVERARGKGLAARLAFGLMTVAPYANVHYWAEVCHEGAWVAYDPVLITSMLDRGALGPAEWHVRRSIGAAVTRIGADYHPLATHLGTEVPVSVAVGRPARTGGIPQHAQREDG